MSASARLFAVKSNEVDYIWPRLTRYLEMALKYADGKYAIEDLYKGVKERNMQLWFAMKGITIVAAGITSISNYPQKKVCSFMFAGGRDMKDWKHFISHIETWAASEGCESVEVWGREGWARVLSGYEKIHTVIRKPLSGDRDAISEIR